jgi:hypothetical protein
VSKIQISPYRTITRELIVNSGLIVGPMMLYSNGEKIAECGTTPIIPKQFDPSSDNLRIEIEIALERIESFFYPSPHSVASNGATLAISLFWESHSSSRRGVGNQILIKESTQFGKQIVSVDFEANEILGDVSLIPKLVLIAPGDLRPGFCATAGGLLGDIAERQTIVTDGKGSKFPIHLCNLGPSGPLWSVHLDWTDALEDLFEDTFSLQLNIDHRDYVTFNQASDIKNREQPIPLALKEIVSSSLFTMILKLRSNDAEWDQILEGKSNPGTIGDLARCFIINNGWDTSSHENLLHDVRKTIETSLSNAI